MATEYFNLLVGWIGWPFGPIIAKPRDKIVAGRLEIGATLAGAVGFLPGYSYFLHPNRGQSMANRRRWIVKRGSFVGKGKRRFSIGCCASQQAADQGDKYAFHFQWSVVASAPMIFV